jgi:hypothetical protein
MIGLYSNQNGPAYSEYGIERGCTVWKMKYMYSIQYVYMCAKYENIRHI